MLIYIMIFGGKRESQSYICAYYDILLRCDNIMTYKYYILFIIKEYIHVHTCASTPSFITQVAFSVFSPAAYQMALIPLSIPVC